MGVIFEQSPQWFAWQPLDYVSNGKEGPTWPHPHMYEGEPVTVGDAFRA